MAIRRLIVNADDFGISRSVNQGIIESHINGIVTSTSILANGPAFDDALKHIHSNSKLGIGIHLNVLRGKPVLSSSDLPNITNQKYFKLKFNSVLFKLNKRLLKEIELEYRAQIEKVLKHNIDVTHLDSEKHHHLMPPLFNIAAKLASEYKIKAIRCGFEKITLYPSKLKTLGLLLVNLFVQLNKNCALRYGLKSAKDQIGIGMTGNMELEDLITFLHKLKPGETEFCCHPGYINAGHMEEIKEYGKFYIDKTREKEMRILSNKKIRTLVKRKKIRLINYKGL